MQGPRIRWRIEEGQREQVGALEAKPFGLHVSEEQTLDGTSLTDMSVGKLEVLA